MNGLTLLPMLRADFTRAVQGLVRSALADGLDADAVNDSLEDVIDGLDDPPRSPATVHRLFDAIILESADPLTIPPRPRRA